MIGDRPNYYLGCAICGKPLRLASAKVGDDVLPMHEQCYLSKLTLKQSTTSVDDKVGVPDGI